MALPPDSPSPQQPLAAGERDFRRVYDAFQPKIRRYLSRLAGAPEADDLTQETFARVSQALPGFRGESSLATWVYRIATNVALDRLRSPAFRMADRQAPADALALADAEPGAERQLARQEMGECIRGFIEQLPPEYRSVVVLSELEELPDREIAAILDLSVETVKIRLHRGRARLRTLLESACSLYRDEQSELACEPKPGGASASD